MGDRHRLVTALAGVVFLCATGSVQAHRLNVFAFVEQGSVVRGQVYMSGGGAAIGATVRVEDAAGHVLAELATDQQGEFVYTAEERRKLTFIASTGDGHRSEFVLPPDDLPDDLPTGASDSASVRTTQPAFAPPPASPSQPSSPHALDVETVDRIVGRHVGALRKQLAESERRARFHEIIGGIGYIVGLCGLAALWYSRRRAPRSDNA